MTISTTISRQIYNGNGVTTVFAFPYRFLQNEDLVVILVDDSTGVTTTQVLNTDYTLSGADSDTGGNVTMVVAPAVGERLVIFRQVDLTQEVDYITGDPFPAETHERALDRLTMITQQLQEEIDRTAKLPVTSEADANSLVADLIRVADSIDEVDTVAGSIANVDIVGGNIANVNTVAGISGNVTTVAGIAANVTTVAGISANVTTVAGINADVTTVAGIAANVTTVANNDANVTTVAGNLDTTDTIGTVAGSIANVNLVGANIANVNTTAGSIANVNTVATNIANVNIVGGISADVTTVAGIAGDIPAAAAIDPADLNTVAGISGNVTTVAGISANVTTVAGISADVTAVAGDATNIGIVAGNIANVNTVAGISGNVTTVAGINADVTAVAGNAVDISTVAGISGDVTTVAGVSTDVPTLAALDTEITALGARTVEIDALFAELPNIATKVSKTSDTGAAVLPAGTEAQRDGTPLGGYLRFNTDTNEFEGYNGTAWSSVGGSAITNDTTTATDLFPAFLDATTGTAADIFTSDAKLLYKPSTGELKSEVLVATNGIFVNNATISEDQTIAAGTNGHSVGPITVDATVTVDGVWHIS